MSNSSEILSLLTRKYRYLSNQASRLQELYDFFKTDVWISKYSNIYKDVNFLEIISCCAVERGIAEKIKGKFGEDLFDIFRMMLAYDRTDPSLNGFASVWNIILSAISLVKNRNVLDYGSGVGDLSILVGKFGYHPLMVNISKLQNDFASYRLKSRGIDCLTNVVRQGDYRKYDKEFVLCIDMSTLEHVHNLTGVLNNIYNLLVPGGIFFSTFLKWRFFSDKIDLDWDNTTREEAYSSRFINVYKRTFGDSKKCLLVDPGTNGLIFIKK